MPPQVALRAVSGTAMKDQLIFKLWYFPLVEGQVRTILGASENPLLTTLVRCFQGVNSPRAPLFKNATTLQEVIKL